MSALRTGIEARLKADSTLMGLVATPTQSVYHRAAPVSGRLPAIIYEKRTGTRTWSFAGAPLDNETWMIKGVAFGRTADRAEAIGARIAAVMTDVTVSGRLVLDVRLEEDVSYTEPVGKELIQHDGGIYRFVLQ